MKDNVHRVRKILGSAGCQPAFVGNLPTKIMLGRLPSTAGKLPALPDQSLALPIVSNSNAWTST